MADVVSTMMDFPLTIGHIIRHGQRIYADSTVATWSPEGTRRASYADVAERAERLAAGLTRLGVGDGDRVGTLSWNHQEHLEAYFAVPGMGAVLHTLNLRLHPEQLAYVTNHGGDRVVIVDGSLVPLLAQVAPELSTVERVLVRGSAEEAADAEERLRPLEVVRYEDVVAAEEPGFVWPEFDERRPAAMCYTSGTTGNPKGVVYSHRSTFLHSMAVNTAAINGITEDDRLLVIVPMFHANAWGQPYAGWFAGADFVLPQQYVQAEHLAQIIPSERPTFSAGVPTLWNDLLHHKPDEEIDLSSLRAVMAGGAAVPRALMERFQERFDVRIIQGWGMTETSPVCALAYPPRQATPDEEFDYRAKTGRVVAGVELRIVGEDGTVLPWDNTSAGEIQVRGPWITGAYHGDPSPEKFDDGWLRTGDVGTVDPRGFVQITDRTKDVIKSGGEWISSVELENALMISPDVLEATVIGVPDERWSERPMACVVLRGGAEADPEQLRAFLADHVPKWWLPDHWTFIDEVPKTSVGKFDKKVLRVSYEKGDLAVVDTRGAS